jgi:eukaryotic-like serine/threonine-protein kinase
VSLTTRAYKSRQAGLLAQVRRWWKARAERPAPHPRPQALLGGAPVIMVAVDTTHPHDERQPVLQRVSAQLISLSAEFRLICVSVIPAGPMVEGSTESSSRTHLEHLIQLRHWVEPLRLPAQRLSMHVIESLSPAGALLEFARRNNVDLIVLGAPGPNQHALAWWRSVASTVTANAHCSVHVVRVPELKGLPEADAPLPSARGDHLGSG